jgi:hypothetical protein
VSQSGDPVLTRMDLLDLLEVCGLGTAGTAALSEDLVAVRGYVEELKRLALAVVVELRKTNGRCSMGAWAKLADIVDPVVDKKPVPQALVVELTLALAAAVEVIENHVPPQAFQANPGPNADGDDASAFYLGQVLRRIRTTLEKAQGEEGPATAVSRMLGEIE